MVNCVKYATTLLTTQAVMFGVFPLLAQAASFRLEEAYLDVCTSLTKEACDLHRFLAGLVT